jgi:Domain of unknown function (DUF4868)
MITGFDTDKIVHVEFCLASDADNSERHVQVPVDTSVRSMLLYMLHQTANELWPNDSSSLSSFELSEKYGSKEALHASISMDGFDKVREIYAEQNLAIDSSALNNTKDLLYYFVIFVDDAGRKIIGVKRASQFKAILSAQYRLIRWIDDSLKAIPDNIFKLDNDFDFIIGQEDIYILRPSGFEYISDVAALVSEKAKEKANALSSVIPFADFSTIAEYSATHKRAARLISAISIRNDLGSIQKEKLLLAAQQTKVELEEVDGRIRPKKGHEIGFLELLDHRRYTTSLTDDTPAAFVASSRQSVAA